MNIIENLKWRYATKKFDENRIVDESTIDTLCEAFNLTATSYGLQPLKLVVVKNKSLQMQLQNAAMNQSQVSTASHVLVICIENNININFIENYFSLFPHQSEGTLAYKNVIIDRFSKKEPKAIKEWAIKQAYITLGNLMTACAVVKVDACPMEGFIPDEVDSILNLKEQQLSSVLLLPVGFRIAADSNTNKEKVRRPIKEIVKKIY